MVFDACSVYLHQAWTNANEKMTVKDYIFWKHHAYRKILKYTLRRVVDPSKKVPDLNCRVQDLLLEVVNFKQEVPDLRSGGIPPIKPLDFGHDDSTINIVVAIIIIIIIIFIPQVV